MNKVDFIALTVGAMCAAAYHVVRTSVQRLVCQFPAGEFS